VWQFHGAVDDVIAPENSRELAAALDSSSARSRYTELPGVGHDCWDAAYDSLDVATWLLAQRRPPR
jgi:predicted peptidase